MTVAAPCVPPSHGAALCPPTGHRCEVAIVDTATHRYRLPLGPDDDRDVAAARLWAAGASGVWDRPDDVVAWFPDRSGAVPSGGDWGVEPDVDWQARWKASIAPVRAGRVLVVPSWIDASTPHADGDVRLVLDPGRAFGTGHHATTLLCLDRLQSLDLTGRSVLDVGCGTGVLAVAAARLGATDVRALDVDADAVAVTGENAAAAGVDVDVRHGTLPVDRPADVVVANLLTDTVVALRHDLVAATAPAGHLIVSGVASDRAADVAGALRGAGGLGEVGVDHRDGWSVLWADRGERGP